MTRNRPIDSRWTGECRVCGRNLSTRAPFEKGGDAYAICRCDGCGWTTRLTHREPLRGGSA
jgi:RNase P subunit RPR2